MTLSNLLQGYQASGGSLNGEPLGRNADRVWALMLSESRGRILKAGEDGPEAQLIQQCFNHMTETAAEGEAGELQSETLGQWSRTYRRDGKSRDQRLMELLRQYLGETGLLYRGWPA